MTGYGDFVSRAATATGAPLAGAFSSAVFKQLARPALDSSIRRRLSSVARCAGVGESLGNAFERAHAVLVRDYRNEYVYKNALVSKIVFGKHSPRTSSALLELGMGNSWADVVIMNGTSTTYEIKTDLDQFARLSSQIADYTGRSEFVNVVTSDIRAAAAERVLPSHVGIVALRRSGALTTIRAAESNLVWMTPRQLFSMTRTGEALSILKAARGYTVDVPSGEVWKRARDLFDGLTVDEAHRGVVTHLRQRGRTAAELATTDGFPSCLRALAYATELSAIGRTRVLERLVAPAAHELGC